MWMRGGRRRKQIDLMLKDVRRKEIESEETSETEAQEG